MGFKCGNCDASLTNKATKNHVAWKCVGAKVVCLSCDKKFSSKNFLEHKSCVSEEEKRPKGEDRSVTMKKLVFKVLEKSKMKKAFKGQLRALVKASPVPTSKANIAKFVDNKIKTVSPVFKSQAKEVLLTAAMMLPAAPSVVETGSWHNECKQLMLATLAETDTNGVQKSGLKTFLENANSPKLWGNFTTVINKPIRGFSSAEVDLALKVFEEASKSFPPKPAALKVSDEWQKKTLDAVRASNASVEDKEALAVVIRKRTVPKDKAKFEKFLNHPHYVPTVELKALLRQLYLQVTQKRKAKRSEAMMKKVDATKKIKQEKKSKKGHENDVAGAGSDNRVTVADKKKWKRRRRRDKALQNRSMALTEAHENTNEGTADPEVAVAAKKSGKGKRKVVNEREVESAGSENRAKPRERHGEKRKNPSKKRKLVELTADESKTSSPDAKQIKTKKRKNTGKGFD